jgi:hypothetical protein
LPSHLCELPYFISFCRYLDAVALPRRFGKPDLFITVTANPQWAEIQTAIPAGSHWSHHPDIVARVFDLKLRAMIDLIINKKLFGEVRVELCMANVISSMMQVLAYVFRIEWQARGMPHAHCLFILKEKLLAARHIDAVVWAEIPCPRKYPILHAIVCKRMIHDPCDVDLDKPCLHKVGSLGVCYRRFPKQFNTVTTIIGAAAIPHVCVR